MGMAPVAPPRRRWGRGLRRGPRPVGPIILRGWRRARPGRGVRSRRRRVGRPAGERRRHLLAALEALLRPLRQGLQTKGLQFRVQSRLEPRRGRGRRVEDPVHERRRRGRLERQAPRQQHVKDNAGAVQVRPRPCDVHVPRRLFRGHVERRPDHRSLLRQTRVLVLRPARQAEIHQVQRIPLVQQDIFRFHVPVQHALLVGVAERRGELSGQFRSAARLHAPDGEGRCQCLAGDERRSDVVGVPGAAGVVDRDDVRVVQPGRDPGLAQEAFHRLMRGHASGMQHLERHVALQPRVEGAVDGAERSLAQQFTDLVAVDHGGAPRRGFVEGHGTPPVRQRIDASRDGDQRRDSCRVPGRLTLPDCTALWRWNNNQEQPFVLRSQRGRTIPAGAPDSFSSPKTRWTAPRRWRQ